MNLGELTDFVCGKVGASEAGDKAACRDFINRRYELIWNDALWRDSLVLAELSKDPATDENYAAGLLLLPSEIDRVLGVRTTEGSVRVNSLEMYTRIDFDKFDQTGIPGEFAVLSPVSAVWSGAYGLKITSNVADDGKVIKVNWRDSAGTLHQDSITLNSANPPKLTDTGTISTSATNLIVISGAGNPDVNATYYEYSDDGTTRVFYHPTFNYRINLTIATGACRLYQGPPTVQQLYTGTIGGNWTLGAYGEAPAPQAAYGSKSRITVESVFKPVLNSDIVFAPQVLGDSNALTVNAADTKSDVCQRLRLFSKPQKSTTVRVLGKRKFVKLASDYESPVLQNVDNVLIAMAHSDMLQRLRQYGKSQIIQQEAGVLLGQLKQVETVQQATNFRIMPDDGFQPAYDYSFTRAF